MEKLLPSVEMQNHYTNDIAQVYSGFYHHYGESAVMIHNVCTLYYLTSRVFIGISFHIGISDIAIRNEM